MKNNLPQGLEGLLMTGPTEVRLKRKQQRVDELVSLLNMASKVPMTKNQKQAVENWQSRYEFRLNELVIECKERELDIKVDCMQETLNAINNKETTQ